MMWGDFYHGGWSWFGAGFMMLFWIGLLAIAVWAVVRLTKPREDKPTASPAAGAPTAQEILDRRLASGEITIEEHERLRQQLSLHASG